MRGFWWGEVGAALAAAGLAAADLAAADLAAAGFAEDPVEDFGASFGVAEGCGDAEDFAFGAFEGKGDGESVVEIVEKPEDPPSEWAVIGIYLYGPAVFDIVRTLKPSGRGELELQQRVRVGVVERTGPEVEVLAERDGHPVLIRQGKLMAATFHPELSQDRRVHEEFLKLVEQHKKNNYPAQAKEA